MPNSASSILSLGPYSEEKVVDLAKDSLREIGGAVTCGIVFLSADWRPHLEDCLEIIRVHGHVPVLVGCSGSGLIGNGLEAESRSGISLLLLHLHAGSVTAVPITQDDLDRTADAPAWHRLTGLGPDEVEAWIALLDPLTIDPEQWLHAWNTAYPGIPVCGGLASGGLAGDDIFIICDHPLAGGGVALALKGNVRVSPLVSQGCRPIGSPFTITGVDENLVNTLGMRPAVEVLSDAFESLPDALKPHAQGNIFAGLAMSEYVDDFKRGDFLIRNIIGANPDTGAVAIGAYPRVGQTLQYQLRDRDAAHDDLVWNADRARTGGARPFASLLFSCTGRGKSLFGVPGHDVRVLESTLEPGPIAGFFCNGEIGPVGGTNFVHGYTASAALFLDA